MNSNDRRMRKPAGLSSGISRLVIVAAAALLWTASGAYGAARIPAPSWMEQTAVAEKMLINGLPSQVHAFTAERRLDEVLQYYRIRWREGGSGAGYKEAEAAPWHIISRLEDGRFLLTVQAKERDRSGCEGYLAIADLQGVKIGNDRNASGIPRLHGSEIVNEHHSFDPGSKGRTVMLVNTSSVSGNGDFYRDYYLGRDWGQLFDQATGDARVLAFGKGGSQVHLVISPSGGKTQVVMNLVDSD